MASLSIDEVIEPGYFCTVQDASNSLPILANSLDASIPEVTDLYNTFDDSLDSVILPGMGLHLECDNDSVYEIPEKTCKKESLPPGIKTRFEISFPSKPDTRQQRYQCTLCSKTFAKEIILKDHCAKIHKIRNQFRCDKCSYVGQESPHLKKHQKRNHGEQKARKSVDTKLASIDMTKDHKLNERDREQYPQRDLQRTDVSTSDDKSLLCSDEKDKVPKETQVQMQVSTFICSQCPKMFRHKNSCQLHEKTHKDDFNFSCEICPKQFISKGMLNKHLASHKKSKMMLCEFKDCNKAFRTVGSKHEHVMRVHSPKLYSCPHGGCKKQYGMKRDLKSHMNTHSQKFKCKWPKCRKQFRDAFNRDRHFKSHR